MSNCIQWCRDSRTTGAIAPVPILLVHGGAPLQFLFHLFLVNFVFYLAEIDILIKLLLVNYLVICSYAFNSVPYNYAYSYHRVMPHAHWIAQLSGDATKSTDHMKEL